MGAALVFFDGDLAVRTIANAMAQNEFFQVNFLCLIASDARVSENLTVEADIIFT